MCAQLLVDRPEQPPRSSSLFVHWVRYNVGWYLQPDHSHAHTHGQHHPAINTPSAAAAGVLGRPGTTSAAAMVPSDCYCNCCCFAAAAGCVALPAMACHAPPARRLRRTAPSPPPTPRHQCRRLLPAATTQRRACPFLLDRAHLPHAAPRTAETLAPSSLPAPASPALFPVRSMHRPAPAAPPHGTHARSLRTRQPLRRAATTRHGGRVHGRHSQCQRCRRGDRQQAGRQLLRQRRPLLL